MLWSDGNFSRLRRWQEGSWFSSNKRIWAKSADAQIEIFPNDVRSTISPYLYGQFTEHIGGVIYDGVFVGEESRIANRYGIRSEIIDRMNDIRVPIIRWPGGLLRRQL